MDVLTENELSSFHRFFDHPTISKGFGPTPPKNAVCAGQRHFTYDWQIINIGSGVEVSMNALVRMIAEVTGRRPSVLYNEKQSGGVSRLVANLAKAQALLGYRPLVDLYTGLRRLVQESKLPCDGHGATD